MSPYLGIPCIGKDVRAGERAAAEQPSSAAAPTPGDKKYLPCGWFGHTWVVWSSADAGRQDVPPLFWFSFNRRIFPNPQHLGALALARGNGYQIPRSRTYVPRRAALSEHGRNAPRSKACLQISELPPVTTACRVASLCFRFGAASVEPSVQFPIAVLWPFRGHPALFSRQLEWLPGPVSPPTV